MSAEGLVIVLNGTSSAGKTSIALALQDAHPEPMVYWGWDLFVAMIPPHFVGEDAPMTEAQTRRLVSGYHRATAAYAAPGNPVVLDTVLRKPEWLAELREALAGHPVCFVGVRCPLEELERRELERGDRKPGTARSQFDEVHVHGAYDLELDTSTLTPEASARRILDFLAHTPHPTAFWPATAEPVTP